MNVKKLIYDVKGHTFALKQSTIPDGMQNLKEKQGVHGRYFRLIEGGMESWCIVFEESIDFQTITAWFLTLRTEDRVVVRL